MELVHSVYILRKHILLYLDYLQLLGKLLVIRKGGWRSFITTLNLPKNLNWATNFNLIYHVAPSGKDSSLISGFPFLPLMFVFWLRLAVLWVTWTQQGGSC